MPFRIPLIDNFPVDVLVFQKRENGLMAVKDKARYIHNKEGQTYYELKKAGTKFRPAAFDNMLTMKNGKVLALLYEYQRDMIVPIDAGKLEAIYVVKKGQLVYDTFDKACDKCGKQFKTEYTEELCNSKNCGGVLHTIDEIKQPCIRKAVNLHAIEEDMSMWSQSFRREMDMRHNSQTFWEKYSALIMMGMVFIFFIIMTNFFMQSITDNTHSLIDALGRYATKPPG